MTSAPKTHVFTPLEGQPDHDRLERQILEWWETKSTFDRLREKIAGAEAFCRMLKRYQR